MAPAPAASVAPSSTAASAPDSGAPDALADDLRDRIDRVRGQLGDDVPLRVEGGRFVFVAPDRGPLFEPAVALAHRALGALLDGRLGHAPTASVTVYVFSTRAAYDRFCQKRLGAPCETPFGFYRPTARESYVNEAYGVQTVTHELVHPLVRDDFPRAPRWLHEGLGALYELPVFDGDGGITGATNWRLPDLQNAMRRKDPARRPTLAGLFATSDAEMAGSDWPVKYATARFFCQWMDEKGWLWPWYRAWRDGVAGDASGERAFETVVGKSVKDVAGEWGTWVMGLRR